MRLATNKWNIKVTFPNGKTGVLYYYGFKTKKEAQAMADKWNELEGHKAEVIKY